MPVADLIEPRTLRGFRDYPPNIMLARERLMEAARQVYRSYGFAPIDTPALEYAEILLGKGGAESDKQIYRFNDQGGRDVALRFDLTVPFARFAAQHIQRLGIPFKRYHLGPVWRGENTGHGRYREFWQCDFDTIGTTSNAADIEVVLVIHDLMLALGFDHFHIHVNQRLILNGLLEELGLSERARPLLTALDKLPKIGRDAVLAEMVAQAKVGPPEAERVLELAEIQGTNGEILDQVERQYRSNPRTSQGVARLRELLQVTRAAGVPEDKVRLDVGIARGLDYYTGTVYETFLDDRPSIGSVCSGGRYDNLAGLFTRQALPGVGASLGLDRLVAAMEELDLLPCIATPAPVLIVQFTGDRLGDYQQMGRRLREAGIGVEVYPEAKKVGQQLQYAERRGFYVALIAGPDEFQQGVWKIKNLARRQEVTVPVAGILDAVRKVLAESPGGTGVSPAQDRRGAGHPDEG
jgi:histidyl-tRNA synthetase